MNKNIEFAKLIKVLYIESDLYNVKTLKHYKYYYISNYGDNYYYIYDLKTQMYLASISEEIFENCFITEVEYRNKLIKEILE